MGGIVDKYGDNYGDIDDQQQYNGSVEHDEAFTCGWAIIGEGKYNKKNAQKAWKRWAITIKMKWTILPDEQSNLVHKNNPNCVKTVQKNKY